MLSGSEITQNDAVKNSKFIFVGKIEEIGPPLLEPVGEKSFHGVKITVITALQGAVAPQILVSIAARIDLKELSPRVNERYVFFANSTEAGGIEVVKLLPADDNTISSTSRLISP